MPNNAYICDCILKLKNLMKSLLCMVWLTLGAVLPCGAQAFWQWALTNYTRGDYHAANQNWMIDQDAEGRMFFANNKGMLVYDGVYWDTYALRQGVKMRSVKVVGNRVYAGGLGEFGYFVPKLTGEFQYVSLSKHFARKKVTNIWHIARLGNRIVFQGDRSLFVYDGHKVRKLAHRDGFNYCEAVGNTLYVSTRQGPARLTRKGVEPLPGCVLPAGSEVVAMQGYEGGLLIVTAHHGLFRYAYGKAEPLLTGAEPLLRSSRVTCAAVSAHFIALGTSSEGAVVISRSSGKVTRLAWAQGLQNTSLLALRFDGENNLWLGLDNGIASVELHSPLTFLNTGASPVGGGSASCVYGGQLYLATHQGVYRSEVPAGSVQETSVSLLPGSEGAALSLDVYDGKLFVGGRNYFLLVDGNRITSFPLRGVWGVRAVPQCPGVLVAGTFWGLYRLEKQGAAWVPTGLVKGLSLSAKTLFAERNRRVLWVANKEMGLYRVGLSVDARKATFVQCVNSKEVPKGTNVCVAQINNNVVVASRHGLFTYNEEEGRLVRFHALEKRLGVHTGYTYLRQDGLRNVWFVSGGMLFFNADFADEAITEGRSGSLQESRTYGPFLSDCLMEDFENVTTVDGAHAVIGTEEGFAMLHTGNRLANRDRVSLHIRRVYLTNGADSLLPLHGKHGKPVEVDYANNSLRIHFGATNYNRSRTVLYSFCLEGDGKTEWSPYTTTTTKEYTNLPEGDYVFRVRIMRNHAREPLTASFAFTVLPPWYRTWWAYTLYVMAAAAIALMLWWRHKRGQELLLERKNLELLKQEEAFKRERALKNEYELVQSRMNVVRKNEMLEAIKKTAMSVNMSIDDNNLPSVKRRIMRLISQIDTNMEHDADIEAFQGSFDAVHHDFFAKLSQCFPELTHKDKMLCAYIKMNLLSKEIAPLLNISVRGVEIARYRLRKKLGLDEKDSLTAFLNGLE